MVQCRSSFCFALEVSMSLSVSGPCNADNREWLKMFQIVSWQEI